MIGQTTKGVSAMSSMRKRKRVFHQRMMCDLAGYSNVLYRVHPTHQRKGQFLYAWRPRANCGLKWHETGDPI